MDEQEKSPVPRVYAAIANVMADIGADGVAKSRNNAQQGYKFRGIDDLYNALSGPLSKRGLMLLPRVLSREVSERITAKGGVLFYVVLDVEFDLVCAEDGSRHTVRVVGEAMDSGDKATNKALSTAYKYACMQVFCIPTEGDNDADSTTHEVQPRPAPQARPTPLSGAMSKAAAAVNGPLPPLKFHQTYEPMAGKPLSDAGPDALLEYVAWLKGKLPNDRVQEHLTRVQDYYERLIEKELGE